MKRYVILTAAVVMQICLGGIYAWSVFVPALRSGYGYSATQTQLVFGVCIATFTLWMILAGRAQDRWGPRPLAMAAGVLLAAGYLLAAAGAGRFWMLLLGAGVVTGLGIGCGYVCPIATGVKWFPHHKAFVCGLAVAGYGAGALLLTSLAEALLRVGWSVREIFALVGASYGAVVLLAGAILSVPPASHVARSSGDFRLRSLAGDRRFWALAVGMFCGTFPGLMIIGNLKPIGLSRGLAELAAASAVGALAVGNAAGRIIWGFIGDRLAVRRSILLSTALIVVSVGVLYGAAGLEWAFPAAAVIVGFCYGSCFALYPAEVAHVYGPAVLGSVYPLVIVWHGLAAPFAAGLGGAIFDATGSFTGALGLSAAVATVGLAVFSMLIPHEGSPLSPRRHVEG